MAKILLIAVFLILIIWSLSHQYWILIGLMGFLMWAVVVADQD